MYVLHLHEVDDDLRTYQMRHERHGGVAQDCFKYCTKMVGGAGTKYDTSNATAAMVRVDGLGGQAGCFSAK